MTTQTTIGFGSSFAIGNGASPEVFTALGEVINITPPGMSRDAVDASHMASTSGFRDFVAGMADGGEVSIELNLVPGGTTMTTLMAEFNSRSSKNYRILFPDSPQTQFNFTGFCIGFESEAPVDDRMTATATFKVTGLPTVV